jgi:hypothetical protein
MILLILAAMAAGPISCELSGGYALIKVNSYVCLMPDEPAVPK